MESIQASPWFLISTSIIPSFAIGLWTVIQWMTNRKDKRKERENTEEQKREAEHERERHEISEAHSVLMRQLRDDVDRYRNIITEKNIERWYAWDRARFWHSKAWDMRNEAAQARQVAESIARLAGESLKPWDTLLELPPFDVVDSKNPPKQTP